MMVAVESTWPCTKWPPKRVFGGNGVLPSEVVVERDFVDVDMARSRLTVEFTARWPRLVRRRVSGAMPSLKEVRSGEREVIVRHVPKFFFIQSKCDVKAGVYVKSGACLGSLPLTHILSPRAASSRISEQSDMVMEHPFPPDEEVSSGNSSDTVPIVSTMPVNIVTVDMP